jgi:hypothetical protein
MLGLRENRGYFSRNRRTATTSAFLSCHGYTRCARAALEVLLIERVAADRLGGAVQHHALIEYRQ